MRMHLQNQSGESLISTVLSIGLFATLVFGAMHVVALYRTSTLQAVRSGQEEDLRNYTRRLLDCEQTMSQEASRCANGDYIRGYSQDNQPIVPNRLSGIDLGDYNLKLYCTSDAYGVTIRAQAKHTTDTQYRDIFRTPIACEAAPGDPFVTVWNTSNPGSSNSNQITLPIQAYGQNNFTVAWGDGTESRITSYDQPELTHTYAAPGEYTVQIWGTLGYWAFRDSGDVKKILEIKQWGPFAFRTNVSKTQHADYFKGAENLIVTATDIPDLSGTVNLSRAFAKCTSLTSIPNMNLWDTSRIFNMSAMFQGSQLFNENISDWDVSQVRIMDHMFNGAFEFNQNLSRWNVSNVTTMHGMFSATSRFNSDISNWDVRNVTNMAMMFAGARNIFNQDISRWDVGKVTAMNHMFMSNKVFNQNISGWDVSNVTTMLQMFSYARAFNQPIGSWDVGRVQYMTYMFENAFSFDQNIGNWDVRSVKNMDNMFAGTRISEANYSALLIGWGAQQVQNDVNFHGGSSRYPTTDTVARNARERLRDVFNWTIIDGMPP